MSKREKEYDQDRGFGPGGAHGGGHRRLYDSALRPVKSCKQSPEQMADCFFHIRFCDGFSARPAL